MQYAESELVPHAYGHSSFMGLAKCGRGKYGNRYDSEFVDDKRHDHGVYCYDRDFVHDKHHSHGVHHSVSGGHYDGDFVHGKCDDHGLYYCAHACGDCYDGDYI